MNTPKAHGFTLVELLVAKALGLAMMSAFVASLSSLYKSVQVSADAAENSETAYFLMDALEQWLSDSRSPMLTTNRLSSPAWAEDGDESMLIDDPCGTPLQSPFDFYRAGVAVVPAGNVSCLPSSSVDESSMLLLVERRVPCGENCGHAGFYAERSDCSSGHSRPKWRSGKEGMVDEAGGEKDAEGTDLLMWTAAAAAEIVKPVMPSLSYLSSTGC
ncbi:MAG: type II secretion system protein [Pseudomonadota bacterium]|nr:type II secretion system protein [Pseudomonadota bacterium]